MIGVFFSLLFSPFGIMAIGLGLVSFFMVPFIPRITGHFYGFARFHQTLAGMILKRAAIVVSEHGDLLLKRMHYDDAGVEMIGFSDTKKEIEDTNGAKSWWLGMRFGLADEKHGFFFTPRDAATGRRKQEAEEADEMVAKATASERSEYDVMGFIRGVFAFPKGVYEMVDLRDVKYLVTGDERAEQPQAVKKYYEISQEPYSDRKTAIQLFLLLAAAVGPFAMVWILYSQFGGADSTVGYGAMLALFGSVSISITKEQVLSWLKMATITLLVFGPLPAILALIAVYGSPAISVSLLILYAIGFALFPVLSQILKASDGAANAMASLLLKLGFLGYDTPVLEYTGNGYETREYAKLSETAEDNVTFHQFLGREFGFTFTPDPSVWDNEIIPMETVKNTSEAITDGGRVKFKATNDNRKISGMKTNIPSGFSRIGERTRAVYGEFVPTESRLKQTNYYVHVGRALERFKHVATGGKSYNRLQRAKEEFGGGGGFEQRTVAILMTVLAVFSLSLGVAIFLLPALL